VPLSGSTGITYSWSHCAKERIPYDEKLQICNSLYGSSIETEFRLAPKDCTADETLKGKTAFEQYAKERGVIIQAYHADNGIFQAYKWVMACREKGQSLSCVNAHY
jgi:hypothetical protein